jgi:hypothetical protein
LVVFQTATAKDTVASRLEDRLRQPVAEILQRMRHCLLKRKLGERQIDVRHLRYAVGLRARHAGNQIALKRNERGHGAVIGRRPPPSNAESLHR